MPAPPVIGFTCSTDTPPGKWGVSRFALAEHYVRCLVEAGGLPLMLPNVDPSAACVYLACLDGIVLSGGPDLDPLSYTQEPMPDLGSVDLVRDAFEIELARHARAERIPTLAICRGAQLMNVAHGGTLLQHIPGQVDGSVRHDQETVQPDAASHSVDIVPDTVLRAIAGEDRMRVNSFHHQACDEIAEGFVVSARALDGVVEAIEDPMHPFCLAVQWHPERQPNAPLTHGLFRALIAAASIPNGPMS